MRYRCQSAVKTMHSNQHASIFFDLDGALPDPRDGMVRYIAHVLRQRGMKPVLIKTSESHSEVRRVARTWRGPMISNLTKIFDFAHSSDENRERQHDHQR